MCDRKSQASDIQTLTHGKPSRGRCTQPCMFEILSWQDAQQSPRTYHPPPIPTHQYVVTGKQLFDNDYPTTQHHYQQNVRQQHGCSQGDYQCPPEGYYQQQKCCHGFQQKNEQPLAGRPILTSNPGCIDNCSSLEKQKTLKPHEVKDELYMYEESHLRRSKSQANYSPKATERIPIKPIPKKKLDEHDERDREVIEKRKQRIKQFGALTRDLPNSAFTTYFGKPTFEAYGRCSSHAHMKTHNVMPHRGENHPKTQESYTSALIHGRKIKHEDHVPRKPLENGPAQHKSHTEQAELLYLPMEKPDLINHVRFSDPSNKNSSKSPVPTAAQTATITRKEVNKKYTFSNKDKRTKKAKASKATVNDGLKYMNARDDLLTLLEAKKTKDSRLAYKVTECYPYGWPQVGNYESEEGENERIAGIRYPKSESAKVVLYRHQ